MAEPENFEDDLFADLYTEDDSAPKQADPVNELKPEPAGDTEMKVEEPNEQYDQTRDGNNNGTGHDDQVYTGEQDDDDEIDFNLGNGNNYNSPPNHEAHGPGIKEDGIRCTLGHSHIQIQGGWEYPTVREYRAGWFVRDLGTEDVREKMIMEHF